MSHHLFKAVSDGKQQKVEELLASGADIEWRHKGTGRTALSEAVVLGHLEIARLLIGQGADIDWKDRALDYTPLTWASSQGHVELVALLLAQGATVDAASQPWGHTPLMVAAQGGHLAIVEALLAAGADPQRATSDARNALSMAGSAGHVDVMAVLKAHGAGEPAPLPAVTAIAWPDSVSTEAAAVLRGFILAMHEWEVQSATQLKADPLAWDVIREQQAEVFARFCTERKRPYGRLGSFAVPPEYQPDESLIGLAEVSARRTELTTRSDDCEYLYVALRQKGEWRLDSKRRRLVGGDWLDATL